MTIKINKFIEFLSQNSITFLIIVFATFINGQAHIIGNIIWLPIGAVTLCYLLFGFRVFFTTFLVIPFSFIWFHNSEINVINWLLLVGTFSPLLAISRMKFFKLSIFLYGESLVFHT